MTALDITTSESGLSYTRVETSRQMDEKTPDIMHVILMEVPIANTNKYIMGG